MTKRNLFITSHYCSSNKKVRNDLNQIVLQHQEAQVPGPDKTKSRNDKQSEACVPSSTSPSLYFQVPNVGRVKSSVTSPNEMSNEKPCVPEKVNYCISK